MTDFFKIILMMTDSLAEIFNFQRVKVGDRQKIKYKITGKMFSKSDSELQIKIMVDKYFRFRNFQTGFVVTPFPD